MRVRACVWVGWFKQPWTRILIKKISRSTAYHSNSFFKLRQQLFLNHTRTHTHTHTHTRTVHQACTIYNIFRCRTERDGYRSLWFINMCNCACLLAMGCNMRVCSDRWRWLVECGLYKIYKPHKLFFHRPISTTRTQYYDKPRHYHHHHLYLNQTSSIENTMKIKMNKKRKRKKESKK